MEELVVEIINTSNNKAELAKLSIADFKSLPLKKDGWLFNWQTAFKTKNSAIYILTKINNEGAIQGVVQFRDIGGMFVMELIELHPKNKGKIKKYENVAGCLIALGCKLSFGLDNNYKGFLNFQSKTKLIDWYRKKYNATLTIGQLMYIDPRSGIQLIEKYLKIKHI